MSLLCLGRLVTHSFKALHELRNSNVFIFENFVFYPLYQLQTHPTYFLFPLFLSFFLSFTHSFFLPSPYHILFLFQSFFNSLYNFFSNLYPFLLLCHSPPQNLANLFLSLSAAIFFAMSYILFLPTLQCDHIWRNFATWANFQKYYANFCGLI